ncbi:MAG: hypothetical protein AB7E77_13070 [Desulfobulbus sp.]
MQTEKADRIGITLPRSMPAMIKSNSEQRFPFLFKIGIFQGKIIASSAPNAHQKTERRKCDLRVAENNNSRFRLSFAPLQHCFNS